jgi:replication initiation and membrane attachment protein DnaB
MLGPKVSNFNQLYREDETLANFIKQSTQQREKRRNKERGPKSKPKEQTPKWVTIEAQEQIMFQPSLPINHKKHIRKRRG